MPDKVDTRYLFRMTDDTGMFQHAVLGVPDPSEGYTSDDNSRALILAEMLYLKTKEQQYEDLMVRYMSYLIYAEKDRWFRNFMGYNRNFLEKRGSEDCFGRCILALGLTVSKDGLPAAVRECADRLLNRVASSCSSLTYLKGKAYALTGLTMWNSPDKQPLIKMLIDSVIDTYVQCRREDWRWFEDTITYCSAVLPLSMFCASDYDRRCFGIGLESLDFLLEITLRGGVFKPVGCKGWMKHGDIPAEFDEQPVEACGMMLACLKAFELTNDEKYYRNARQCFLWYVGENSLHLSLIDPETGGCRDGLTQYGLNGNEGAESIVCWLISALTAEKEHWLY
ncbi:MAG TPA: glycosyltransferase [Clostridia bacterium]|nr:glycosyltransferase [Clostridia bacterium]